LGDASCALESLSIATKLSPPNPWVSELMGIALAQRGRLEEAKAFLQAATRLDPASQRAAENLARLERGEDPIVPYPTAPQATREP